MNNEALSNQNRSTPIIRNDYSKKHAPVRKAWQAEICKGDTNAAEILDQIICFYGDNRIDVENGEITFITWYLRFMSYLNSARPNDLSPPLKAVGFTWSDCSQDRA